MSCPKYLDWLPPSLSLFFLFLNVSFHNLKFEILLIFNNHPPKHSQYIIVFCSIMFTLVSVLASLKKFREEVYECPICLKPCTDTLVNPECNHRFCKKCIKESLRKCNHECPTCRAHIPTYRTCRRDPQFDHIVSTVLRRNDIQYVVVCVSIIIMTPLAFNTLLMEICYCVQLDRPIGKGIHCSLGKK